LTLKVIAEHYITTQDFDVAQITCERALSILESYRRPEHFLKENPLYRKEIEFLRSDIYFILGKVQHIQMNIDDALESYLKAVKLNDKNLSA